MISEETIGKLAFLLGQHALYLKDNEIQKQVLINQDDFVLLNLFERIDKNKQNSIASLDIVDLMRDNKIIISEADAYIVIAHYDSNFDDSLSLNDFQLLVTPHKFSYKKNLRKTQQLYSYGSQINKLSYELEYGFVKVIEKEIETLKNIEFLKQELISQHDWSGLAAFRAIDEYSHGVINNDKQTFILFNEYLSLRCFLRKYEVAANIQEEDLSNLIRCYDKNVDKAWSFKEFVCVTSPLLQYQLKAKEVTNVQIDVNSPQVFEIENDRTYKKDIRIQGSCKTSTTAQTSPKSQKQYHSKFNMRNISGSALEVDLTNKLNSTFNKTENEIIINYPYEFDKATPSNLEDIQFKEKLQLFSNTNKNAKASTTSIHPTYRIQGGQEEMLELARAFFDMSEVEGIQEKKKRDLVLRQDFNLKDLYQLFNSVKNSKRGIDCDDLYYSLTSILGLSITKDEVFILFYKLDKNKDGFISYSELSQPFIPKQHEYSVLLQSRHSYYGEHTSPKAYFSGDSREILKRNVRGLIDCEISIELVKQRIQQKLRMTSENIFKFIDTQGKRLITLDDLRNFLKQFNILPMERDLQLVFERFDRDEDGVISYHEFVSGITPFMNLNSQ